MIGHIRTRIAIAYYCAVLVLVLRLLCYQQLITSCMNLGSLHVRVCVCGSCVWPPSQAMPQKERERFSHVRPPVRPSSIFIGLVRGGRERTACLVVHVLSYCILSLTPQPAVRSSTMYCTVHSSLSRVELKQIDNGTTVL